MVCYINIVTLKYLTMHIHSVDVVTVPASASLQRQLNVDNVEMQPSPAYVSLDSESPRLYQNI